MTEPSGAPSVRGSAGPVAGEVAARLRGQLADRLARARLRYARGDLRTALEVVDGILATADEYGIQGATVRSAWYLRAELLNDLGDTPAAYALADALYRECVRTLPAHHPAVVRAAVLLAGINHHRGDLDAAEELCRRVLAAEPDERDGAQPATRVRPAARAMLLARVHLALIVADRGDAATAIDELTTTLRRIRDRYGARDLDALRIASHLADLHLAAGDRRQARRLLTHAHHDALARFGPGHPVTARLDARLTELEPPIPTTGDAPAPAAYPDPAHPDPAPRRSWRAALRRERRDARPPVPTTPPATSDTAINGVAANEVAANERAATGPVRTEPDVAQPGVTRPAVIASAAPTTDRPAPDRGGSRRTAAGPLDSPMPDRAERDRAEYERAERLRADKARRDEKTRAARERVERRRDEKARAARERVERRRDEEVRTARERVETRRVRADRAAAGRAARERRTAGRRRNVGVLAGVAAVALLATAGAAGYALHQFGGRRAEAVAVSGTATTGTAATPGTDDVDLAVEDLTIAADGADAVVVSWVDPSRGTAVPVLSLSSTAGVPVAAVTLRAGTTRFRQNHLNPALGYCAVVALYRATTDTVAAGRHVCLAPVDATTQPGG